MNTLIWDANSLYARSYFAAQRISTDPKETLRLALNTVFLLLDPDTNKLGCPIDATLFAWDSQQNEDKKRTEKPAIYHETKAELMQLLERILGTVNATVDGVEGDDIVATAVFQADPKDMLYIASGDKDLMQLKSDRCLYYSLNEKALLSDAYIRGNFHGIKHPNQVALELAIVGDPVDNIKGVHKYGEKKCRKLFEAVTKEMTLEQAAAALVAQLNEEQTEQFYASLDRTLLRPDVPGVPPPAPLRMLAPAKVDRLGIPQIDHYYHRAYAAYYDVYA